MYIYIKHRLLTSPKYFIAQLKGRKPLKNKPESGVISSKDGALNKSNLLKFSPLSLHIKLIISLLYYNKKSLSHMYLCSLLHLSPYLHLFLCLRSFIFSTEGVLDVWEILE